MKAIQLLFVLVIVIQADITINKTERCECPSFVKAECDTWFDCKWTTACEAKQCSDYVTEDKCTGKCSWKGTQCKEIAKTCSDMPTEESCSNMAGCGWKSNACISFTTCKDFIVSKAERCNVLVGSKGEKCQPQEAVAAVATGKLKKHLVTATATAGVQCVDKVYIDCSKLTTQTTCKGDATATAKCQWKSDGKCYAFELKSCSDATGFANLCDTQYCKLNGTTCVERTCADITTQALCTTLPKIDKNISTLCSWQNNKCAPAADSAFLTATTCNTVTFGSYHWVATGTSTSAATVTGTCQKCTGWMLSTFLILLALIAM